MKPNELLQQILENCEADPLMAEELRPLLLRLDKMLSLPLKPGDGFVGYVKGIVAQESRKRFPRPFDVLEREFFAVASFDQYLQKGEVGALVDGGGLPLDSAAEYTRVIKESTKSLRAEQLKIVRKTYSV